MSEYILCIVDDAEATLDVVKKISYSDFRTDTRFSATNPFYFFEGKFFREMAKIIVTTVDDFIYSPVSQDYNDPIEYFTEPLGYQIKPKEKESFTKISKLLQISTSVFFLVNSSRKSILILNQIMKLCEGMNKEMQFYYHQYDCINSIFDAYKKPISIDSENNQIKANVFLYETNFRIEQMFSRLTEKNFSLTPAHLTALGYVVDSFEKKECFEPKKFYTLQCNLKYGDDIIDLKWKRKKLWCKLSCYTLFASAVEDLKFLKVASIDETTETKEKPLPLNYIRLYCLTCKYLTISEEDLNSSLTNLYKKGMITYPFTETNSFNDSFDPQPTISMLASYKPISTFAAKIEKNIDRPRNGSMDNSYFSPIYPTKLPDSTLSENDHKLYEFISRYFLAAFSRDALISKVIVTFSAKEELFTYSMKKVQRSSWLTCCPHIQIKSRKEYKFQIDEEYQSKSFKMNEVQTKCPSYITKPKLMKTLEKERVAAGKDTLKLITDLHSYNLIKLKKKIVGILPSSAGCATIYGLESVGLSFKDPYLAQQLFTKSLDTEQGMCILENAQLDISNQSYKVFNIWSTSLAKYKEVSKKVSSDPVISGKCGKN